MYSSWEDEASVVGIDIFGPQGRLAAQSKDIYSWTDYVNNIFSTYGTLYRVLCIMSNELFTLSVCVLCQM